MWHPFDIMPGELALEPALRTASAPPRVRLVFGERITRWFKDKSEAAKQWPPTVDRKEGLTLSRRPGEAESWDLGVRQVWQLTNVHTLEGTMSCAAAGWRTPRRWSFRQTFLTDRGTEVLPSLTEEGAWKDGVLTRTTTGKSGSLAASDAAPRLAAAYGLMADFPLAEALKLEPAGLLQEGLAFSPDASLRRCSDALQKNPLANGLTGFVLHTSQGYPSDFWVNPSGLVVYVCFGPNRAFVLDRMEEIA